LVVLEQNTEENILT